MEIIDSNGQTTWKVPTQRNDETNSKPIATTAKSCTANRSQRRVLKPSSVRVQRGGANPVL
jgi:hypothetical protein